MSYGVIRNEVTYQVSLHDIKKEIKEKRTASMQYTVYTPLHVHIEFNIVISRSLAIRDT